MFWKKKKALISNINSRLCKGCESCVQKCRNGVLEMASTADNKYVRVYRHDLCSGCGSCAAACSVGAINLIEKDSYENIMGLIWEKGVQYGNEKAYV